MGGSCYHKISKRKKSRETREEGSSGKLGGAELYEVKWRRRDRHDDKVRLSEEGEEKTTSWEVPREEEEKIKKREGAIFKFTSVVAWWASSSVRLRGREEVPFREP